MVGGGIAGIQAALEIANAGFHVYLVEREPSIGGHMAQFDKTFPTLDCSACILTPRMVEAGTHPNITLLTWSEVMSVSGYVGNFNVTIKKRARFVNEELCTGCGICVEKCPQKVIDDVYEAGLGYRKVIYNSFAQAVPKYPVLDAPNCTYFKNGKCKACEKFCPTNAIDFTQQDTMLNVEVGNIVLATGYDLFDARRVTNYGYGRLPNVFTSMEFERLSNASGPTGGEITLRDGKTKPETVGIIHCVGSRDKNFNNYCSAICCMQSLKFAHLVKERTGATVYDFYIDMRTAAKSYDEFYQRIMEEGTLFVRGKVAEVTDAARNEHEKGKLIIQVEDTFVGKQRRIPVDMVILSSGMEPRHDAKQTGQLFGISCSSDGWYIERHPKLDPVTTMTEGVHDRRMCQRPQGYSLPVWHKVRQQRPGCSTRSCKRKWSSSPSAPPSTRRDVSGCRICNTMCPFNAIAFIDDLEVSRVNPALCQGCGTCVAACPAGVISGSGFSNEQIYAQIDGILMRV